MIILTTSICKLKHLKKITTLLLVVVSFSVFGQNQKMATISGVVLDKTTQTPLEYATVIFTNQKDVKTITGGITNQNGTFNITIPKATYNVTVEYIGYKTKILGAKTITTDENFDKIFIEENAEALDEVEIIAEKTTVEIKLDKKVYNVGKDLTVRGGNVSDVLDNVPSVSVDVEGNVALRGNDNVRILINGKPSGLIGLNSTEALRQLPAEAIEKVEVITAPSARYDAEGTGGILNIILRRSKLNGLNGAITTNAGYNPAAGISGNINYRTGDINLFNTTSYNYKEAPGNTSDYRESFNLVLDNEGNIIEDKPNTFSNEVRRFDRTRKVLNTNLGLEWYINKSSSLTSSLLYSEKDNTTTVTNNLNLFDENKVPTANSTRLYPELNTGKTLQYALNFDKQFKGTEHTLTLDFQHEKNDNIKDATANIDGLDSEKVLTIENQKRILLQADYALPINEKSQFEIGFRNNYKNKATDYTVSFKNSSNSDFTIDTNLSNLFTYTENITAVYTQFGSKIKAFSYLLGLRYEDTQIRLNQASEAGSVKNQYSGVFPTVNLNYELSKSENITLAYNRRISRPRSHFLNPFPSRSSVTSVFQGNPALAPSFSGTFDLGYLKRFGKFTFDSSLYYTKATDVVNFINFDTGETVSIEDPNTGTVKTLPIINRTPVNLGSENRQGFEFTFGYRASRKWNINANFNVYKRDIVGTTPNGINLDNTNTTWLARINNKYTLPGKIDWQTRLVYKGPNADALNKRKGIFSTNLAFSKDLFKDKASLAFNIADVFNSRKRQQTSTTPTYISTSEFQWRERSFNLSFTYRFNQKKKRNKGGNYGQGGFE